MNVISKAIGKVNELLPVEERLSTDSSTLLFGDGSALDSLGRVNLIVAFEEQISQDLGFELTLMDELANPSGILDSVGSFHTLLKSRLDTHG